jgi:pimeloyl-ACP methyl ester carboxylesterase
MPRAWPRTATRSRIRTGSSMSGVWAWWAVQPRVAEKTRACVYDRAGFGFSDPAAGAATSSDQVDDLHALRKASCSSSR